MLLRLKAGTPTNVPHHNALHRLTAEQLVAVAVAENIAHTNHETVLASLPQSALSAEQHTFLLNALER